MGSRLGPILVIEDDPDDQMILKEVFDSLRVPNEIKVFSDCFSAYHYLETTADKPFLIFSDINIPKMSGAELKKKINAVAHIRRKSIPFVFLTTTSAHEAVLDAYESIAQGFFTKPNDIESLKNMIQMILNYWKLSRHPDPNRV
ncbi:MAG TPA: response regulator [Chitinophagaceae bacterium]|jgi:CheY-like chemotaxis protein|nr:response regulator [Chitinophagaceae bacterium]